MALSRSIGRSISGSLIAANRRRQHCRFGMYPTIVKILRKGLPSIQNILRSNLWWPFARDDHVVVGGA
jgi:hypothetical protein